jgi:hypothetical protein
MGLVDYAAEHMRDTPGMAHLGALRAAQWSLESLLEKAGREIDADAACTPRWAP